LKLIVKNIFKLWVLARGYAVNEANEAEGVSSLSTDFLYAHSTIQLQLKAGW